MKATRVLGLLAAAAALQFLFGASAHRAIWPVDFFLLATAVVARSGDFVRAVLVGGALGLFEDALNHELLGMNAFAKAMLGYLLALLSVRLIFGGPWAVGGALALASVANDVVVTVLAALLLQAPVIVMSRESLWRATATGVTGGLLEAARIFPWREWWEKRQLRRLR